jgi:23S rRNA pseudouridine1911/1915/1917 synthase
MEAPIVLHQDDALVVINKPPGWIVHAGAGTETGELITDWFMKNYPEVTHDRWPDVTRIGIVHRLDKDTSGVMVLAKSPQILDRLQDQFKNRQVQKVYHAIVFGVPSDPKGELTTYIGRHPKHRQMQTVLPLPREGSIRREAITRYEVDKTIILDGQRCSLISFYPQTGRMHQLRVHAKHLGIPILGDTTYTTKPAKKLAKALGIARQMLHADSLMFRHPLTNTTVQFKARYWPDMQTILHRAEPKPQSF